MEQNFGLGKEFLDVTPKAQVIKKKIVKLVFVKSKIFANYIPDFKKTCIQNIYRTLTTTFFRDINYTLIILQICRSCSTQV